MRLESGESAVRDTLVLGGTPYRTALGPDGTAYVAGYSGLMSYDSGAFTLIHGADAPLVAGSGFTDVEFHAGRLYLASFDQDRVSAVDPSDGSVTASFTAGDGPAALGLRVSPSAP